MIQSALLNGNLLAGPLQLGLQPAAAAAHVAGVGWSLLTTREHRR